MNSGVSVFASPMNGVRLFGPQPFLAAPMKPQCSGMPTTWTGLRSQISGCRRRVTTALAQTCPRLPKTRTRLPLVMPRSSANWTLISTKNSGCNAAFTRLCLVQ